MRTAFAVRKAPLIPDRSPATGSPADGHPRHLPALDGIRGVAIVWVVLHNATDITMAPAGGIWRLLGLLTHPGWIGVQLFFALSGFLITGGLLDTQGSHHYFRDFYAKRALRILPLYYGVLLALLVVMPRIVAFSSSISSAGQASLWLFTVNWTHTAPYGFAHFWSLAVEEQFYLLWPLVVWKLAPRRLLRVCLWVAVGALLLRGVMAGLGADWWTLYTNTACRMDALALGSAGACLLRIRDLRAPLQGHANRLLTLALILFLGAIPFTHVYDRTRWAGETFGYSVLALAGALFVTAVALSAARPPSRIAAFLGSAPLRSLGKYSYAMYVFHGLLHKLVGEPWLIARYGEAVPASAAVCYALVLLLVSYLLGFCSYELFERHFLKLKSLFASQAQARGLPAG